MHISNWNNSLVLKVPQCFVLIFSLLLLHLNWAALLGITPVSFPCPHPTKWWMPRRLPGLLRVIQPFPLEMSSYLAEKSCSRMQYCIAGGKLIPTPSIPIASCIECGSANVSLLHWLSGISLVKGDLDSTHGRRENWRGCRKRHRFHDLDNSLIFCRSLPFLLVLCSFSQSCVYVYCILYTIAPGL